MEKFLLFFVVILVAVGCRSTNQATTPPDQFLIKREVLPAHEEKTIEGHNAPYTRERDYPAEEEKTPEQTELGRDEYTDQQASKISEETAQIMGKQ
jgi:hypothetical protein